MPSPDPPRLGSGRVRLRPSAHDDVPLLAGYWLTPAVARWWPDMDEASTQALVEDPDITAFTIEHDGEVAGFLQTWEEEDPQYRHAGIDLMLAPHVQGHGVGPEAIRLAAHWLFEVRGHHRITIDPAADNARARKAYEKVGFVLVGVMRSYERDADGKGWHDGALYDLLASDLVDGR